MGALELARSRGPESLARVVTLPQVEIAYLWALHGNDADDLTGTDLPCIPGADGHHVMVDELASAGLEPDAQVALGVECEPAGMLGVAVESHTASVAGSIGVVQVEVTTWSLELRERSALAPALVPTLAPALTQVLEPSPELGRFLYTAVGGDWYWVDRLPWTYAQWLEWQERPGVETWIASVGGAPAGYFELDASSGGEVEIAYLGLLPRFIGRGIGRWLLTCALERAWELGPQRVWVHTCSLDGPVALANYRARGMQVFHVETRAQELDVLPPGPWPGADAPGTRARPLEAAAQALLAVDAGVADSEDGQPN